MYATDAIRGVRIATSVFDTCTNNEPIPPATPVPTSRRYHDTVASTSSTTVFVRTSSMGNTVTKAREAHNQAKSKPKNTRDVRQQKIKAATTTGVLALPNSKLKKLPDEVLQLSTLRTLDVTSNQLSDLPPQLSAFAVLKTLKLSFNAFETLPDLSTLQALTTVRHYASSLEISGYLSVCVHLAGCLIRAR